jgi:hypothetical protein
MHLVEFEAGRQALDTVLWKLEVKQDSEIQGLETWDSRTEQICAPDSDRLSWKPRTRRPARAKAIGLSLPLIDSES